MNPLQAFQAGEEKKFDNYDTSGGFPTDESVKNWIREHDARLISFLEGYVKPPKNEDESYERNVTETGWDNACLHIEKKFRELRSNEQ